MKEIVLAENFAICPDNVVLQGAKAMVSLKKRSLPFALTENASLGANNCPPFDGF